MLAKTLPIARAYRQGWSLTNASYSGVNFSVATQETDPRGMFFGNDGFALYVLGAVGDDINQYTLSTAWDISTASYTRVFSVAAREAFPSGLFFKPDGLRMYVLGAGSDNVLEYELASAWDISTSSFVRSFSVVSQDTSPRGMFFREDGTKLYIVGEVNRRVNEYTLGTAWNISTISFAQNFSLSAQEANPKAVFFKPDGLKMYVCGTSSDSVNEYNLSSGWDISTASFVQSFSVAGVETSPQGLFFKPNGLKMYIVGSSSDAVWAFDL